MSCLICESDTNEIIDFGQMPIANAFIKEGDKEHFYNLKLMQCPECKMVQLDEQPDRELMFNDKYPFFSSSSTHQVAHFKNLADQIDPDAFVVELGSNDGIFLQNFKHHLGVEPSKNVHDRAIENGINSINTFFDEQVASEIAERYGQADIIYAANVLCHIKDIHSVLRGVQLLLKKDGAFIFEDPYLGDIVSKTAFDQIYDEHCFYFSIESVENLMQMHIMDVYSADRLPTHGGSMRYTIKHGNFPGFLDEPEIDLTGFAERVETNRQELHRTLMNIAKLGASITGYGATSKSTTLLNHCAIGPVLLDYIVDTTPEKHNKLSPGAHVPVVEYERFHKEPPEFALLLAWNHAKEIMEKEKDFKGTWITYVPEVKIHD